MTFSRMLDIAVVMRQIDPINWIQRLRAYNRETDPPRVTNDALDTIIANLTGKKGEDR